MKESIVDFFMQYSPVTQALIATLFTWFVTAAGAGLVFFTKRFNQKLMDGMLGLAAGVMIAASFWSLLAPAIDLSRQMGLPAWLPAVVGFLAGAASLRIVDRLLPHGGLGAPSANGLSGVEGAR